MSLETSAKAHVYNAGLESSKGGNRAGFAAGAEMEDEETSSGWMKRQELFRREVSSWSREGCLMGSEASRQVGSSGKEYARRLRALKLPALGHSSCFFVGVAMREEFGRACMNHADRHGLITTAKYMLWNEIPLPLFSFISLPQT